MVDVKNLDALEASISGFRTNPAKPWELIRAFGMSIARCRAAAARCDDHASRLVRRYTEAAIAARAGSPPTRLAQDSDILDYELAAAEAEVYYEAAVTQAFLLEKIG